MTGSDPDTAATAATTDHLPVPAPRAAEDDVGEGALLAGRYELRRLLGEGGMSRVFLAYDRDLARPVAVKLLAHAGSADDLGRLRDEARAAAAIDHPGVVTVHDVGTSPVGVHVVMSYLEGETLAQRLERDGPLPPEEVAAVGRAVCGALAAAHRAGVVHRDISPGNIMLGPDGAVTVTDFGIARLGDGAGRTKTGYIVGTPSCIAPEQVRGTGRLDGRVDLYALACCLFTALTGRPPFTDPDPFTVVLAHLRESPPRPSSLVEEVPPALEAVLLRALSKDPSRRYQDAAAMADALTAAVPASLPASLPAASGPGTPTRARTRQLETASVADPDPDSGAQPGPKPSPVPTAGAGVWALDSVLSEVDHDDGTAADRGRRWGVVLIMLAVLLAVGAALVAVVLA
ncbi:hypothetical protein GCM10023215_46700 [Pseudonocardia yuanmonensis]|uniref:non-specific serine/threonine protein kinase n=1 Tax=Pseudonocardia yuanmonensis TaxID=1095914 RepID=A0ABP8XB32_9PSEU